MIIISHHKFRQFIFSGIFGCSSFSIEKNLHMIVLLKFMFFSLWTALIFLQLLFPVPSLSAENPPVEIGVIVAQSGKAQYYGESVIRGAQLAVEEINQHGGVLGRRLQLAIFNNKSTALSARQAATKAVYRRVVSVVGAVWSTHSLAVAPVLQKHEIPMISPGSTAPEVTRTGHFIFRTCYTDDFQGKLMADFAFKSTGYRRAAVLTNISETYSKILAHYFSTNFILNGGEVIFEGGYKGSATDYLDILQPLTSLKPEVVFVPGYSQDSGLIIKQARKLGINAVFMGGDAWETAIADYAGAALEGSYFSTFWHPNVPYPKSRAFMVRFTSIYGKGKTSTYAPLAYDAVWLLKDAIQRSNSLEPKKIRNALAATQDFQGITGHYSFDAYGNPINKGASILKFKDGCWVFYKAFDPP
jgi:branched-chain amino acid transport system substrate-binding protein